MRSAEMGEDPATGSAVGPLCAHVAARTGAQRLDDRPGRRDGPPEPCCVAAVEGDRVRVGGDAVIVAEGAVHLWTPDRFPRPRVLLRPRPAADQRVRPPGPPLDGNGPGGRLELPDEAPCRDIATGIPPAPGRAFAAAGIAARGPRDLGRAARGLVSPRM